MRKIIIFLVIILINTAAISDEPDYIDSVKSGVDWYVIKDTIISERSIIDFENITIKNSLNLKNMGNVNGNIFVADGCQLILRNSGTIKGEISVGNNATLVQRITTNADISNITVNNSNFSILIKNSDTVSLSDVMKISGNAEKIVLDNSSILIGNNTDLKPRGFDIPVIELVGNVRISVNKSDESDGGLLLSNVYGNGVVSVDVIGLDSLYTASTIRRYDNIYLDIYRETDYQKVIGGSRGIILNQLRASSPNNPIISAMDREGSLSGLYSIISKSILFNPINLMGPIKIFNNFETNNPQTFNNLLVNRIEPLYILNNGLSLYGGKTSISASLGKQIISISGYIGRFENNDYINNFSGTLYGGNIRDYFNEDSLWLDAVTGVTATSFETDMIMDGDKVIYNPSGLSVYSAIDTGLKFDMYDNFYFAPFVGIGGDYEKVLYQSDSSIYGRLGGYFGFSTKEAGIKNEYQIFGNIQMNNIQTAGIKVSFWSIADDAGGSFSYSLSNDDYGLSQKISLSANFIF